MNGPIAIIVAGVAACGLAACGGGEQSPETTPPPITITVAPVIAIDTAERLEAGGVLAAAESASVSSRIVAPVVAVRVKAGDRVRAGDVLVTLDARDVTEQTSRARSDTVAAEQALVRARAEQAGAESDHRLATAWQTRIATLHARNSATDQERDEAEARLAAAVARLAGAEAAIGEAEARLQSARGAVGVAVAAESFTTIRAPFNGLVTERLLDPGNLAAPGVPLLRIESDGPRQVVLRVDEARAAYVHPGDRVEVRIDAVGEEGAADTSVDGVVAEVARAIGADQRAFTVKVTVRGGTTARSGSFARVMFRGASRRALVVPAQAIQRYGQVSSVFVVQDGRARVRLVQLGPALPEGVEVLAGVDAGESIITSPLARVVDGAAVTTAGAPAPAGGGS